MPRQIHILFNLVALFIISYLAVGLFYKVAVIKLNRISGPQIVARMATSTESQNGLTTTAYNKIIQRNIFGATEKVEQPPVEVEVKPVESLEETSLQLSLLGTIAGDLESARAIILDQRKRSQDIYRVGDTVQNAEIKQILRGKVILRRGDKDEVLTMAEGGESSRPAAVRGPAARTPARTGGSVGRPEPIETQAGEVESETIPLAQKDLDSSMNNLSDLMTQVRVRPYFRRGKPEGIIVSQIQTDSIFAKLGLMNGDIIASVNGRQMSTPEEAFEFYNSLKSGENVSIEITRRGQKKMLTYDIQ